MKADSMLEKTAVFSLGDLTREEEPRSFDLDEPTRELPLIAGRFAGREWDPEDLRREFRENRTLSDGELRRRRAATLLIGAVCAVLLLAVSMLGQAGLADRNAAPAASAEITSIVYEENVQPAVIITGSARGADGASRLQRLRQTQESMPEYGGEDRVTVLNVRRGSELRHFWQSLTEALGSSFR